MVKRSEDLEDPQKVKLLELALEFESIWSLQLKHVGPAKVTPLVVRPKRDAKPKRCKSRKYPPEHIAFMRKFVRELTAADCVDRNSNALWSSPVYVVRNSSGGYRLTIDLRYVNSELEPVAGIMPSFEVVLQSLYHFHLQSLGQFDQKPSASSLFMHGKVNENLPQHRSRRALPLSFTKSWTVRSKTQCIITIYAW
jgi:hypothetical protein